MTRVRALIIGLVGILGLIGCEPRGQLTTISDGTRAAPAATVHELFVGTTRARSFDGQVFGASRSAKMNYARFDVSIPPTHVAGEIEGPSEVPDPNKHFVVKEAAFLNEKSGFKQGLSQALASNASSDRSVTVFIHGYNTNFPEALYRFAQAHHDFENPAVPVLFTWPSAASTVGYLYDRDSALLARDHLVEFIRTIKSTGPREITLIAHSMGSLLLMEALRQMAVTEGPSALDAVSGVILMSPDIDVQVFQSQARAIGNLPKPFVIFSSQADRALKASETLARDERLGNVEEIDLLEEFEVTVFDVTALSERRSLNHLTTITSPEFIDLVVQLEDFGERLDGDIAQTQGFTLDEAFNRAREITLAPFQ